ncbi:hypothetical protein [Clostridium sp. ZS2-4]|uniref:hypothetical protein n=1 Tax=Clostridium sp. ZS2-4 TaxID=2987703 RepID=UPI00227ACCBE|nr:hypothetical protein [Clostridium sp. ZS2-4]MCY6356251.1 hypothetical protein [Clostridium sp. ZS2-4]
MLDNFAKFYFGGFKIISIIGLFINTLITKVILTIILLIMLEFLIFELLDRYILLITKIIKYFILLMIVLSFSFIYYCIKLRSLLFLIPTVLNLVYYGINNLFKRKYIKLFEKQTGLSNRNWEKYRYNSCGRGDPFNWIVALQIVLLFSYISFIYIFINEILKKS